MTTKHTLGPYSSDGPHTGLYLGGHHHTYWTIHNQDTGVCILILPDEDNTPKQRRERIATTAFIVRACNNFEALLKAAEAIRDDIEIINPEIVRAHFAGSWPLLRAAIAAAKGGQ
mgnify:CR=1 FL=1